MPVILALRVMLWLIHLFQLFIVVPVRVHGYGELKVGIVSRACKAGQRIAALGTRMVYLGVYFRHQSLLFVHI